MARILGLLIIAVSLLLNLYFVTDKIKNRYKDFYTVTRVIDGDTFIIDSGANVRLLGVDAPEMGRCGSQQAKDFLEKTILNKKVKVSPTASDSFRRLVADVYLDGKSVNNLTIVSGWASFDSSDSINSKQMRQSGELARKNKTGIFSQLCSQMTNDKCQIKANWNDATGNKLYHLPNCPRYENVSVDLWRGDQWFCTEKEAIAAGFTKSKVCP